MWKFSLNIISRPSFNSLTKYIHSSILGYLPSCIKQRTRELNLPLCHGRAPLIVNPDKPTTEVCRFVPCISAQFPEIAQACLSQLAEHQGLEYAVLPTLAVALRTKTALHKKYNWLLQRRCLWQFESSTYSKDKGWRSESPCGSSSWKKN